MFWNFALACLAPCILAEKLLTLQDEDSSTEIPECKEYSVYSCEKVTKFVKFMAHMRENNLKSK